MSTPIDRRRFISSCLVKTGAGLVALNELLGPGALTGGIRYVSAAERGKGASSCEILPETLPYAGPTSDYQFTYTAGDGGLPCQWALVIRCPNEVTKNDLSVTSDWPELNPDVTIRKNSAVPCVVWIDVGPTPLPAGRKIFVEVRNHLCIRLPADCGFAVLEMNPAGPEPEVGSGCTFLEVPTTGGRYLPKATTKFRVALPSMARAGEPLRIRIAAQDQKGYGTPAYEGTVHLFSNVAFRDLPSYVHFAPEHEGSLVLNATPLDAGIIRLQAEDGAIAGRSNPCACLAETLRHKVYWGDYHKHSVLCDGLLDAEEIYRKARKNNLLDWAAISSHDMKPFPERGACRWSYLHDATEAAHEPGAFITYQGYEWTFNFPFSPLDARGHKVVIFLNPNHLLPLIPYTYETGPSPTYMPPTTLLAKLKERAEKDVIVIPHHLPLYKWWVFPRVDLGQMGGPLPAPSRKEIDEMEPVAEVFSHVHGNNESYALKDWIKPPTTWGIWPIYLTFWENALMEGVRAGAVCASDGHQNEMGGALTAVLCSSQDRVSIFRAIQKRNTYGTSGPRALLQFNLKGTLQKMGDIVPWPSSPGPAFQVAVLSPVSVERVEIVKVRYGQAFVAYTFEAGGQMDVAFEWQDGCFDRLAWSAYYLRVHLDKDRDGAWCSPIWIEPV